MDYQRASRIAEWTLAALVVGLHLVIFLWPETRGKPRFLLAAAHDAQMLAGVLLIFAWAVLGPGQWWLRLGSLPVLLALWAMPWNTRILPRPMNSSLPMVVASMAGAAIVVTRLCGFRVQKLDLTAGPERGAQFSLWGMLVVTTLVAAAVGGLEALRPTLAHGASDRNVLTVWLDSAESGQPFLSAKNVRQMVMALAVALSALGGMWVVARPGAVWFRLASVAATVPVLAGYLTHLSGDVDERATVAVNLGIGLGLIAVLTGVSVLPLRIFDYRLQRKAAPVGLAKAIPADRSRLMSRAALLGWLVAFVGLAALCSPFIGRLQLKPPATAFAHWVSPPPVIDWSQLFYYPPNPQPQSFLKLNQLQPIDLKWNTIEAALSDSPAPQTPPATGPILEDQP